LSDLEESIQVASAGKSSFNCTLCDKEFTRKFLLMNHISTHQGVRKHACPECGKLFTRFNDCKRHQKLHERGGQKTGLSHEVRTKNLTAEISTSNAATPALNLHRDVTVDTDNSISILPREFDEPKRPYLNSALGKTHNIDKASSTPPKVLASHKESALDSTSGETAKMDKPKPIRSEQLTWRKKSAPDSGTNQTMASGFSDSGYASVQPEIWRERNSQEILSDRLQTRNSTHGWAEESASLCDDRNLSFANAKTNYSVATSATMSTKDQYIAELVDDLVDNISLGQAHDQLVLDQLCGTLPRLFKAFARNIGYLGDSQQSREVMVFVSKHKE
jgi:hypothetical protein